MGSAHKWMEFVAIVGLAPLLVEGAVEPNLRARLLNEVIRAGKTTDPDELRELAKSKYPVTKIFVVENPNTPYDVLRDLVEGDNAYIRKLALEKIEERFPDKYAVAKAFYDITY